MFDFLLYGIFAPDIWGWLTPANQHLHELARTPFAINLGIFGALLLPFLTQTKVRIGLIRLSIVCLFVMTGLIFTSGVLIVCCLVFLVARGLQTWAKHRGASGIPHITAWIFINALYLPLFFLTYPSFSGFMEWGELVLFWGLAFLSFKAIHYLHLSCKEQVDPFAAQAFERFLLYMIHFPSFWFGPYQKFLQFDGEVDTCKERINRENRIKGAKRIALGVVKFIFIFHVFNVPFFYKLNFYGPFAEDFFANAQQMDRSQVWLFVYIFGLRVTLFISAISDGVIGMNQMMGIRVPENANWPLLARDNQQFWQRWHTQAGVFLREEVFFPVGGLRHRVRGFMCVFMFSGFWHFPSVSAVLIFPLLHLVLMEMTNSWKSFWKKHKRKGDWIHKVGIKYRLHDSWLSGALGIAFTVNINVLSVVFIHDHFFGGSTVFPRMFGF